MTTVGSEYRAVRSYQRIFRPDRRIYQVEGHRIPIPGGIPLVWLGYATATLVSVLLLAGRSPMISLLLAAAAAAFAIGAGGRRTALPAALGAVAAAQALGLVLGVLDWPLRLLVVPGLIATLGTQATPDGRSAHRYALSWLALQVRPVRRLLGRALPVESSRWLAVPVALRPDHHGPVARRGRVTGPATIAPTTPMVLRQGRWPWSRGHATIGPPRPTSSGSRPGERLLSGPLRLQDGERLEVRS